MPKPPQETSYRLCNLCGSDEQQGLYEISGYRIVRCLRCSLAFVAQDVAEADLSQYYGKDYFNGGNAQGYADYEGRSATRMQHFRSLLPSLRRYLDPGQVRALDVGCATGLFLEVALEQGWAASGVELSAYAAQEARTRLGIDVFTGKLEDARFPSGSFGLVTLWDVIEHLRDPKATLAEARRLLHERGLLVLSTGDLSGVTARVYGRRWALLAPPGHLFYFSRHSLFAMLRQVGFEPLEWQSDGAFLLNNVEVADQGGLRKAIARLHHNRWLNAVLRRLKLGSIITVFARRCGPN